MSCQGGHADVVPPNPEDLRLNRSDDNPEDPRLNCSDESPETLSRIQEAPGEIQGSEFPLMGCTGKFVGLESSHGFPLAAMDLDPEGPPVPAFLEKGRKTAGHNLEDFKARGLRRPHRKVKAEDLAKGSMSVDLAGPYRMGLGQVKYALVAVYRLQDAEVLEELARCFPSGAKHHC